MWNDATALLSVENSVHTFDKYLIGIKESIDMNQSDCSHLRNNLMVLGSFEGTWISSVNIHNGKQYFKNIGAKVPFKIEGKISHILEEDYIGYHPQIFLKELLKDVLQ